MGNRSYSKNNVTLFTWKNVLLAISLISLGISLSYNYSQMNQINEYQYITSSEGITELENNITIVTKGYNELLERNEQLVNENTLLKMENERLSQMLRATELEHIEVYGYISARVVKGIFGGEIEQKPTSIEYQTVSGDRIAIDETIENGLYELPDLQNNYNYKVIIKYKKRSIGEATIIASENFRLESSITKLRKDW